MLRVARSTLLVLVALIGSFLVFHLGAFPLFWSLAEYPAEGDFTRLRVIFLTLYAGMLALAVGLSVGAGMATKTPWQLTVILVLPITLVLGFFSFFWLEFLNACEIGDSLIVDSRC